MPRTVSLFLVAAMFAGSVSASVPTPEEFIGRKPGEDRFLVDWPSVVAYHQAVAAVSDRVSIMSAGESTLGNDMPVVVVSSKANQKKLGEYREIARKLANADRLDDAAIDRLVGEGKVIALVTCSIHSSEVGATQMTLELVHDLATTQDPEILGWLDEVILLLMPSINPDGQVMVIDWYNKQLGTEFEGTNMPWLYHHYVGHDNNRDFYMLTQAETKAVNRLLYHDWFPQLFLDEHQMGSTGVRMFVPPQADPLALEIHPLIFRQADLLGTSMAFRLEEAGRTGVGSDMIFDSYWPGGTRNTAWWKNVTGLLTEVASAKYATPIYVDPNELQGSSKGLPEYKRQANFPSPWTGGWWRLRDIMDYEYVATMSFLETAAENRESFLRNFATMSRSAAQKGAEEAPYAWVVAPDQHDPVAAGMLVELLLEHGVRVSVAPKGLRSENLSFPPGTTIIEADQPYREFLMTMLRPQRYPEILPYRRGPVLPPYDATSWSLPIAMGVDVVELNAPVATDLRGIDRYPWPKAEIGDQQPGAGWLISHSAHTAATLCNRLLAEGVDVIWLDGDEHPRGEIFVPRESADAGGVRQLAEDLHLPVEAVQTKPVGSAYKLTPVRVGLFKPWRASMDEGWTRFVLENADFDVVSLSNHDIETDEFSASSDVVLLPDVEASVIVDGTYSSERARRRASPLPPEYAGGIGDDGKNHLVAWVKNGGTLVALNRSSDFAIDLFELPVTNVLAKNDDGFSCPGSMLRLEFDTSHPLAFGMREVEAGYFRRSPAFLTRIPNTTVQRRVVARYPNDHRDLLVSGYLKGGKKLERRAAVVEFTVGEGRVVLIGFRAQNRAQTYRSFKLLFNALHLAGAERTEIR